MTAAPDIVARLRSLVNAPVPLRTNGVLEDAALEIENLRALVDQSGVTIAQAMLNGLPPLPWRAAPSHGGRLIIIAANGSKVGAIWGDKAKLVTSTILALVNQDIGPQGVKVRNGGK